MPFNEKFGMYVPTTDVWDTSQIYSTDVTSPEFKELLVRLYLNLNRMSLALNLKDTGYYTLDQFLNSQLWFPNPALNTMTGQFPVYRQVYRIVINFGALPNAGTKSVPHNIPVTNTTTFTRIYGTANDTTALSYLPLPYASPVLANNIELNVDATNVNITTGSNRTNYTITYVVLEFILS